jgi:MFS family permease
MSRAMPRFFYGYWILAVIFLCNFVANGCVYYPFGMFTRSMSDELDWSRGETMLAMTIQYITLGLSSPLVARTVERFGVRAVLLVGAVISGLGLTLMTFVSTLWQLYFYYGLLGLGFSCIGFIPTTMVVSNWFDRRRGWALGIIGVGVGAGGFVFSPVIGSILIPNLDWRFTYLTLGLITWASLIPPIYWFIKTRPADMGLVPDGMAASSVKTNAKPGRAAGRRIDALSPMTLKQVARTPQFWLVLVSLSFFTCSMSALLQNQAPAIQDEGFSLEFVSLIVSVVGVASAVAKFGFGWLCDLIQPRFALSMGVGLQLIAMIMIMNMTPDTPVFMLWLYAVVYGLGLGGWLPGVSMVVSTTFGLASYGVVLGAADILRNALGGAAGPFMAGYIYDVTGSYHLAWVIGIALFGIAIITLILTRPLRQEPVFETTVPVKKA